MTVRKPLETKSASPESEAAFFPLLPNMPIPKLAFEQLPLGEATETERRDIHSFGCAIQNQFHHACARGGGGFESRAA